MYAVTGITGQVGGAVARALLSDGRPVRAVVRDAAKATAWRALGCDVALADLADEAAVTEAFRGVEAVFLLPPPIFDPEPGFPEIRTLVAGLRRALVAARPQRLVCLSTIGAQAAQPNLLNQLGLVEQALRDLPMPVAFLRPAWFMENALWDVAAARAGTIQSFLQPLDKPVPMVATADIGRLAATLLQENWTGQRVVELEGPRRVSPKQLAAAFARVLGHPVAAEIVPRDSWETLFRDQGMRNPAPRAQMIDGFNEGWIEYEGTSHVGETELDAVVAELVRRAG
jgi:NAD(P)H dehydrogenase (quinone)